MNITIKHTTVDHIHVTRTYKTLKGAQKFAEECVGSNPELWSTYAISDDGCHKVEVVGISLNQLFPLVPTD